MSADSFRSCQSCGDLVETLSPRDWCEACEETSYELAYPELNSPFDAGRTPCPQGGEDRWSARWLMERMGYTSWQYFEPVIERAKQAAANEGFNVRTLFMVKHEMADRHQGGGRKRTDYMVSRYAAYLIAMNGDPRKPECSAAQHYFAVKTREAEVAQQTRPEPPLQGPELVAAALIEAAKMIEQRDVRIHQLESKVTADAPKVAYIDQYVTDADCLTFSTIASINNVKESWLRELLIAKQWIYVQTDTRWSNREGKKVERNRYSEKADKKRYFRRIPEHKAPRFRGSEVMHTLKITPQGAEAIARLVSRECAA